MSPIIIESPRREWQCPRCEKHWLGRGHGFHKCRRMYVNGKKLFSMPVILGWRAPFREYRPKNHKLYKHVKTNHVLDSR